MNNVLQKYLEESSKYVSDEESVIVATEADEFEGLETADLDNKGGKFKGLEKAIIREEDDEDICEEDEDICEEDEDICEEDEDDEEGDEIADDDQIETPKKKKMDIKENYITHANRWM